MQSGDKRFAPRIVGATLYTSAIALLIAALVWLRDPAGLKIAFFALVMLALLIVVLIAFPDLNPFIGNFLATLVTIGLLAMIGWGAVSIAAFSDEREPPSPGPPPPVQAAGRIRFNDHRPAVGAEVSIPLLRLSDRTNTNGSFYLGQIDRPPGADTLDLQIAIDDTVFLRRIVLDAAPLDIVLPYLPRTKTPPDSSIPVQTGGNLPDPPSPATPESEPRDQPATMTGSPGEARAESPGPPSAEPETRARPVPTTGSVLSYLDAALGGQQYKHFGMTVTGSGTCRLHGRVQVLRGGRRDIHIVVLTEEEFEAFRDRRPYSEIFRVRNTSDHTLDVELPGPGVTNWCSRIAIRG